MTDDLRQRIADELPKHWIQQRGPNIDGRTTCVCGQGLKWDSKHRGFREHQADAVLEVVQPEPDAVRRTTAEALASMAAMEAAQLRAELDRTRTELATASGQLRAIALVRVWHNEDGAEFMFANDIRTALNLPTTAVSTPTTT